MSRKFIFGLLTGTLILALIVSGFAVSPIKAQESTDVEEESVLIEVTGVVLSVEPVNDSVSIVTLSTDDGEVEIKVNPATAGSDLLTVDAEVTIIASLDDDDEELVAKDVALVETEPTPEASETPEATPEETPEATPEETPEATATPEATESATCGGNNAHPVATRLAAEFEVSYDEIMGWHCQGFGFGGIAKAYRLAKLTGKNADEYFEMKKGGMGWGNILKGEGYKNKDLGGTIKSKKGSDDDDAETTSTGKGKAKKTKVPKDKGNNGKGKGK